MRAGGSPAPSLLRWPAAAWRCGSNTTPAEHHAASERVPGTKLGRASDAASSTLHPLPGESHLMNAIPFRQVHLDFHTSEKIPGVGSEFDANQFVETLKRAAVNSITLFSRCHHGMIYHDTRFTHLRHPGLKGNL